MPIKPLFRTLALPLALLAVLPGAATAVPPLPVAPQDADWLYRGSDIPRDPAWRFGTLPNGMRYAVRRNALPAGQVSIRLRIEAGSLHEEDAERGWAHFVEHMVFRGTQSFGDREARHIWQQLGASFGSDSNAFTSPTQTVYQLDLPKNDRASLDTSLNVLSEMVSSARFDPALVEAEKRVVLAEKGRRPELQARILELSQQVFQSGLRIAQRDTIGTEATLQAATAEGLRGFYRRWYRPERATIVVAGDADPEMLEGMIRDRFGGWTSAGPAPAEPNLGQITEPQRRVANLAYPGAPNTASILWLRPHEARPHTLARERLFLEDRIAAAIINRRLEAHARGESRFINAGVSVTRQRVMTDATQLTVVARGEGWQQAWNEAFGIIGDALRAPPSREEIDRELQNIRTSVSAAVTGDTTVLSQARAQQLIGAIDARAVVTSPTTVLANFEANAREMSPERIGERMRALFTGSGPRVLHVSPQPIAETALAQGLATAQATAPATRRAERRVSFAELPALGAPGREVSRQRIEDMDVTIVRFDNGSTLTFKQTNYERGTVHVRLRFGNGLAGLPADQPSLGWAGGIIGPSGLANLDLDGVERLLTGRRMMVGFGVAEDAFVLSGQTNTADLPDQLRLLATKLQHPRWDQPLFGRFQTSALESFELSNSSASARAGRELGGVMRPNDARWRPVEQAEIRAASLDRVRSYFEPHLQRGPVHAIIVGDVSLDAAVAAMRSTVAALPRRPEPGPAHTNVRPPAPSPEPRRFTHAGDPNQAFAMIGWSTLGGVDRTKERRALGVAANILQVRLFDRLREEEGASYSPSASHSSSERFADWGMFTAAAEVRPEHVPTFFRVAREVVADLAARPVAADEFTRALNPVLSGVERRRATNGYWVQALENWVTEPREIENVRTYLSDYQGLTAEDVRRAVATFVTEQGDWSMIVLPSRGAATAGAGQSAGTR